MSFFSVSRGFFSWLFASRIRSVLVAVFFGCVFILVSMLLFVRVVGTRPAWYAKEKICVELLEGHYIRGSNICIPGDCYHEGSCGQRSYAGFYCDRVKIGDHVSQFYLRLGEPSEIKGNRLLWAGSKLDPLNIEAVVENEHIVSFKCPYLTSNDRD